MVYRLSKMKFKTKVLFFCSIWIFSVLLAILGAAFITTAAILPNTPYVIQENPLISDIRDELGPWESWNYYDAVNGFFYNDVTLRIVEGHIEVFTPSDGNLPSFKPYLLEEVRELDPKIANVASMMIHLARNGRSNLSDFERDSEGKAPEGKLGASGVVGRETG